MPAATSPADHRAQTVRILALSFLLLGASFGLLALNDVGVGSLTGDSVPWWAMALGFAAAGMLSFDVEIHREAHSFTFSEVPLVLGLVFAGPAALIVGRVVGETAVLAIRERQRP